MDIETLREETKKSCSINIILPKEEKIFYEYWLRYFVKKVTENSKEIKLIAFGKQDIRGGISITFFDNSHCVPYQTFFCNKFELLGFVCGAVKQSYTINKYLGGEE